MISDHHNDFCLKLMTLQCASKSPTHRDVVLHGVYAFQNLRSIESLLSMCPSMYQIDEIKLHHEKVRNQCVYNGNVSDNV